MTVMGSAMLRHYVFLKYREETSDGHIAAFCEGMLALRGAIGKSGISRSPATNCTMPRSWSLVLIMEFASVDALRAYQRHPRHLALMAFNDPFVENVASVDFTAADY